MWTRRKSSPNGKHHGIITTHRRQSPSCMALNAVLMSSNFMTSVTYSSTLISLFMYRVTSFGTSILERYPPNAEPLQTRPTSHMHFVNSTTRIQRLFACLAKCRSAVDQSWHNLPFACLDLDSGILVEAACSLLTKSLMTLNTILQKDGMAGHACPDNGRCCMCHPGSAQGDMPE